MIISTFRKSIAAFTASLLMTSAAQAASPEVESIIAELESKSAACKVAMESGVNDRAFACVRSCQTGINYLNAVPDASISEAKQYHTACNKSFGRAGLGPTAPAPAAPAVPAQGKQPRTRSAPLSVTSYSDAERLASFPEKAAYCVAKAPGMACPSSFQTRIPQEKREACDAVGICQNYCSTPALAADRASGEPYKKKQAGVIMAGCERNWEVVRKYLGDG